MDRADARNQINTLVKQAQDAITEATQIADATGVGFSWDLAYGMGGYYTPKPIRYSKEEALKIVAQGNVELSLAQHQALKEALERDEDEEDDYWSESGYGWQSSSANC
jgi:hypothetical protein